MIEIPDSGPWKRIERIGDALLILGDCRKVFPFLKRFECCITDPPFSEYTHGNAKSNRDVGHCNKAIDFKAIDFNGICDVLSDIGSLCDRWLIATMDWRHIAEVAKDAPVPWEFVRFGVWVKTNPMPQISADRPANGWDGIIYLHNKRVKKEWSGGGSHGNWIGPLVTDGAHPTGKPIAMIENMVDRFTTRGKIVLDPYMGSGTTGVACVKLGRRFIGIELDKAHFNTALVRITNAYRQKQMFPGDPYDEVTRSYEQVKLL